MKLIVSTHQGILYNEEVDYVVVHNADGEFAILKEHIPVIAVMDEGYVKMVKATEEFYIVITNGILEFHDNVASLLAQEAHLGKDKEEAKQQLVDFRKQRLDENRKEQVDFTQKEKELREHLRNSKAGQL
ncbi:MAG: F0F1 ATP synthase subunit epsilon [Roseburia sp.]|nr:F0F1 ATP synthase subunit epsilon [Anaeroplasma bactoclasticum]MCM1195919.1 F0F1 ATP synthase subunit epsilon [Roseburia sp.]MCM1556593.1 F0F1 ATP synthase subunit epsilon [Anaeroplasma bactoclasticum]